MIDIIHKHIEQEKSQTITELKKVLYSWDKIYQCFSFEIANIDYKGYRQGVKVKFNFGTYQTTLPGQGQVYSIFKE